MHALFRSISRFRRDQRGNIAVIFVIALIPILTAVGCAIDYSRASRAISSMQSALDSTALMVSKDLSQGTITTANIGTTAQAYFSALYTDTEAQAVTVSATYTVANGSLGSTIQLTGSANIKTDFMQIVGLPNVNFNTSSTAAWGANLLRVALVLDNTGSMNDYNKIGALKTAAQNLVTQLSGLAKNNGDVYISAAQARRCELVSGDRISGPVRTARRFLGEKHVGDCPCRFDVLAIDNRPGMPPEVRLHKDAFSPQI